MRHDATHRSVVLGGVRDGVTRSERVQNRVVMFDAMRNSVLLEKSEGGSKGDEGSQEKACGEMIGEARKEKGTTGAVKEKGKKKREEEDAGQ